MVMKTIEIIDLGVLSYKDAYISQRDILEEKKRAASEDRLLIAEHPAVFTIGRTGSRKNLYASGQTLKKRGIEVIDVDRGGDITFHGPGQIVAYPILDLRRHAKDIRLYIKNLERVLELIISEYGLKADGGKKYTGLWTGGEKIGFIGIGVSNWVTFHGFSINANVDLSYFSMIKPCGIDDLRVNSLQGILKKEIEIGPLKNILIQKCCEVFGFERSETRRSNALMAQQATA